MKFDNVYGLNSPDDLKKINEDQIVDLCENIRSFLIDKVGKTGGHLASNLGVVELSVALHRVFQSPSDHIIFDVGHQSYVHKIITGRRDRFEELRVPGGLSGFTQRKESPHDPFGAGHSSTALSAAIGFAEAEKLSGNDNYTVCVIGDGAFTGGMVHEALNNCRPDLKLIIILNENGMSISKNRGAFASYLSRVRISNGYMAWKKGTRNFLEKLPLIGRPIKAVLAWLKRVAKYFLYEENYFEQLGLYYLGPFNGNDYKKVEAALKEAKNANGCVVLHLTTVKGKGLAEAEQMPESFHNICNANSESFNSVFAESLNEIAENDDKIVAVTAAMGAGTGLNAFEEKFPKRYFDVGIAEEHALTFSAGLAASGLKPFCAIYSTFLQRGYDNILHDISLQDLPVRMFIDRAGISVRDGATHHGIFDVSFLSHIPGVEILAPMSYNSLRSAVNYAWKNQKPLAIRYSNAAQSDIVFNEFFTDSDFSSFKPRFNFDLNDPPKFVFVTYGMEAERVLEAERKLRDIRIECGTVLVERLKPLSDLLDILLSLLNKGVKIVFAEEGIKNGGVGMITAAKLLERGATLTAENYRIAAIDDNFVTPDVKCDLYDHAGISSDRLVEYFK